MDTEQQGEQEQQKTTPNLKTQKGFDFQERMSLKIDVRKAERYRRRKKKQPFASKTNQFNDLRNGLHKIRKKIKDVYDDEEEDDEYQYVFSPQLLPEQEYDDNKLMNALTEDEKRNINQKQTIERVQMQQMAGKMEALQVANNLAMETMKHGISRQDVKDGMQDALFRPDELHEKLVKKEVGKKLGIKGKIEDGKIIQAARGIKKVQEMGGNKAAKDMEMKDVVSAGEGKMSDKELAKLILKKSGQDVSKYESKKNSNKNDKEIKLKYFDKQIKNRKQNKEY